MATNTFTLDDSAKSVSLTTVAPLTDTDPLIINFFAALNTLDASSHLASVSYSALAITYNFKDLRTFTATAQINAGVVTSNIVTVAFWSAGEYDLIRAVSQAIIALVAGATLSSITATYN